MAQLSVEITAKIQKLLDELKRAKDALGGIGVAAEKLVSKLKNVGEKMSKIGKSMTTYLTLPLAAIAGASIKMASDFEESLNKVDVAFKSSSKEVRKFAETTLETFGIAEGTALDMAALFGDMATSMGVPTDKAAELSTAMVGLAGDLSSFKNVGIKEVTTALNGVFTGETESLKMLGIVMTETNLKQFALSKGMSDNIQIMTQAQKVQLRYAYILDKTKNAQGDFARTSDGSANQMRIFSESVKELSVAFGEILLPYFTKAITYLNKVAKAFTNLSPATKKIIVVVAALVAVIGPLLIGLGFLSTTIIPLLISGFVSLTGVMLANPFGLLAVAIASVVSYFVFFNKNVDDTIKKQSTLSQVNDKATKSIANQKAKLAELLAIARHDGVSKSQRIKAIQELNNISPKYLGNLTLETINTDNARIAVENYNKELLKTAKVKAAQSKLQAIQSKIIDIELKEAKKLVADAIKLNKLKNEAVTIEDHLKIKTLERVGFGKISNGLHSVKLKLLEREQDLLLGIITSNKINNEVIASGFKSPRIFVEDRSKKNKEGNDRPEPLDLIDVEDDNNQQEFQSIDWVAYANVKGLEEEKLKLLAKLQEFNESANNLIAGSISQTFSNLGSSIGEALASGGNVLSAVGNTIIQGLSSFLSEMGGMLVKYGTLAILKGKLDLAILAGGPLAIGAGIAAVAVGVALSAAGAALGQKSAGGSSGDTGSSNFRGSSGGGNFGASSSGGMQNVVFEIQGTKLVGVISNTLSRNRSLGGSLSLT